uniref:Si:ch73-345f18.3 n=1 Tax=Poecilia reticulata TaxID=8081 RepID=A0A3P9N6Z7_POERE
MDQRFTDMAEIFNEQQEHYEAMVGHIRKLKQSCDTYRVSLKMKGYDFSLILDPVGPQGETEEGPVPLALQRAQNEFRGISDSAKATVSKGAKLFQLLDWLLRSNSQMVEQVKGAAETYQEQGRLNDNLEENIKEVRRAKELSQRYRKQAD